MEKLPENILNSCINQEQGNKIKQREALENAYTNFVEPHVNQSIAIAPQPVPSNPIIVSGFCCASGWLLLTLFYCLGMRGRRMMRKS